MMLLLTIVYVILIYLPEGYDAQQNDIWLEYGQTTAIDTSWTTVTTTSSSFRNGVVLISKPDIDREQTFIPRIRNLISSDRVEFEFRLYQPNDSYCSKEWTVPEPLPTPIDIRWIVVEKGIRNISGYSYFTDTANISRVASKPIDSIVKVLYPKGCISPTETCRYSDNTEVGIIAQLQTLVHDRILIPRVITARLFFARFFLQSHDSSNESYAILQEPETLGFMTLEIGSDIACSEGLVLSAYGVQLNSSAYSFPYEYNYGYTPGLFGMVGSAAGISDSLSVRSFGHQRTGSMLLVQEDQCEDEETAHLNVETGFILILGEIYVGKDESLLSTVECGIEMTSMLSSSPSFIPSTIPTNIPSCLPTGAPTAAPTEGPTSSPSGLPSADPSRTPSVNPSEFPSSRPSEFPTSIPSTSTPSYTPTPNPTSLPSREDVLSYYNSFDSADLIAISPIEGELMFSYYVNSYDDLSVVNSKWTEFVGLYLDSPIKVTYYQLDMWVSWLQYGASQPMDSLRVCGEVTDTLLQSLLCEDGENCAPESNVECDETTMASSNFGSLCMGCYGNFSSCTLPEEGVVVLPSPSSCSQTGNHHHITKYAVVIVLKSVEYVMPSVPTINEIFLNDVSKYSLLLSINVSTTVSGGTIYCNAYPATVDVATVLRSHIKRHGKSTLVPSSPFNSNISITINELIPKLEYQLFCYSEDSLGNTDNRERMLQTRTLFTTTCCRDIILVPPATELVSTESDVSLFSFTISSLAGLNDYNISITPEFTSAVDGTTVNGIEVFPRFHFYEFDNRARGLSRSFAFVPSVVGAYVIYLFVSGPGSEVFINTSAAEFEIVGSSVVSPPLLLSATFDSSGSSVAVCFDADTDLAYDILQNTSTGSWACSRLFTFSGAKYSTCTWLNSRCLKVGFCERGVCERTTRSDISLIFPGDSILLLNDTVRAACTRSCSESLYSPSHAIVAVLPSSPVQPVVKLSVTVNAAGACKSDLVLDASSSVGAGVRDWFRVEWSVLSGNTTVESISAFLNSFSSVQVPISVPYSLFTTGVYTFGLRLTNFIGGVGYASVQTTVEFNEHNTAPALVVEGPSSRFISRYDPFQATMSWTVPECLNSEMLQVTYQWKVYKGSIRQPHIVSRSVNPKKMRLDPYTLESGAEYYFYAYVTLGSVTQSSVIRVGVDTGSVYVSIRGAKRRHVPQGPVQVLDASLSTYEDMLPGTTVALLWSCKITRVSNTTLEYFDSDCGYLIEGYDNNTYVSSDASVIVLTVAMQPDVEYTFTATSLWSTIGVISDSVTISLSSVSNENDLPFSPLVYITSSMKKFITSKYLKLSGSVILGQASLNETTATWSIFDSSANEISLSDIVTTPLSQIISRRNRSVSFPLSVIPDSLAPGRSYVFRLSAGTTLWSSYAEVTITANGPPTSGALDVVPKAGYAMKTVFALSSQYWEDDSVDFPLSYAFQYSLGPFGRFDSSLPVLYISQSGQSSVVSSTLPAGTKDYNYTVYCKSLVSDVYGAVAESLTTALVEESDVLLDVVSSNLAAGKSVSSTDSILQTINNIATYYSTSECSHAPNCTDRHRHPCFATPHTCGSCIEGYIGVNGNSNVECFVDTSIRSHVASCSGDSDCAPQVCISGTCADPSKECPSLVVGSTCSGHGECIFANKITLSVVTSCLRGDDFCEASCLCSTGYYGSSCSMTAEEYYNRTVSRGALCEAMRFVVSNEDPSNELIDVLASSLAAVINSRELNTDSFVACMSVLQSLSNYSDAGYLTNDNFNSINAPHSSLATVISSLSAAISYDKYSLSSVDKEYSAFASIQLSDSVSSLIRSIGSDMVGGEKAHEIVTDNIRLAVRHEPFESMQNAVISPPSTSSQSGSYIILPTEGLNACGESSQLEGRDYIRISMMEWAANPHTMNSSRRLVSRVLRFSSFGPDLRHSDDTDTYGAVYYDMVLQLAEPQNWTHLSPGCSLVNGGVDTPCPCTVLTYSAKEVHYRCSNVLDLCPSVDSSRRLSMTDYVDTDHPHHQYLKQRDHRRRLDFDYAGEADDGGEDSDSVLEYGALVKSLGTEVVRTVSNTSFNWKTTIPIVVSLGILVILIMAGVVWFYMWDEYDKQVIQLAPPASQPALNEDIRRAFMSPRFLSMKEKASLDLRHMNSPRAGHRTGRSRFGSKVPVRTKNVDTFFQAVDIADSPIHKSSNYRECDQYDDRNKDFSPTTRFSFSVESKFFSFSPRSAGSSCGSPRSIQLPTYNSMVSIESTPSIFEIGSKISAFIDNALPGTSLLDEKNGWVRFLAAVLREHDWIRPFTYSSRRLPRLIRFLTVVTDILILLFADSLFYGILFPSSGACDSATGVTEKECLDIPSKFQSDQSRCEWDSSTQECNIRPPPTTIEFYMFVAILVTLLSIVPQVFCASLLENACACQPRAVFSDIDQDHIMTDVDIKSTGDPSCDSIEQRTDAFGNKHKLDALADLYAYYEHLSCEEEVNMILSSVDTTLSSALENNPYPWQLEGVTHHCMDRNDAVMELLGVHPDGSPVSLTFLQWLFFGSSRKRVEWKIAKVRRQYRHILDELACFERGDDDCIGISLLQHFILEQLPPFQRYALRKQFFQFDNAQPEFIDRRKWMSAWIILVLIWLFLLYFIFQWAVVHSYVALTSWSFQILFVLIQDVFVNQLLQIFVIHVVVIESVRPQLRKIYNTLNDIVINKIEYRSPESIDAIHVCQHMSAACRAARHSSVRSLPCSQLLMRIEDPDVAICRAHGRKTQLSWAATAMLMLPTALSLTHETIQESVLDILLPTLWSCFCIANVYVMDISPVALAVPYVCLAIFIVYRYLIIQPQRRKKLEESKEKKYPPRIKPFVRNVYHGNIADDDILTVSWRNMNLSQHIDDISVDLKSSSMTDKPEGENSFTAITGEESLSSTAGYKYPEEIASLRKRDSIENVKFRNQESVTETELDGRYIVRMLSFGMMGSSRKVPVERYCEIDGGGDDENVPIRVGDFNS